MALSFKNKKISVELLVPDHLKQSQSFLDAFICNLEIRREDEKVWLVVSEHARNDMDHDAVVRLASKLARSKINVFALQTNLSDRVLERAELYDAMGEINMPQQDLDLNWILEVNHSFAIYLKTPRSRDETIRRLSSLIDDLERLVNRDCEKQKKIVMTELTEFLFQADAAA